MAEQDAREDAIEYLRHGFNLYDELVRNSFTDDAAVAELVVIRCEEFVCGLSLFYYAVPWPEGVCLSFQQVIGEFQERISRLIERFNFFDDDNSINYVCPLEENVRRCAG